MPIHPYIVHFPIAFFLLEGFLLLCWKVKKDESFERFAFLILQLGLITGIAAMAAGLWDADFRITNMIKSHVFAALGVFGINTIRFVMRRRLKEGVWQSAIGVIYTVLVAASLFMTGFTGHLGGVIVHQ